jgi:cbb3-type cytochrome oxidase subunit 3
MIHSACDQAFLLVLITICLGACFVWAFWEIEEARRRYSGNARTTRR